MEEVKMAFNNLYNQMIMNQIQNKGNRPYSTTPNLFRGGFGNRPMPYSSTPPNNDAGYNNNMNEMTSVLGSFPRPRFGRRMGGGGGRFAGGMPSVGTLPPAIQDLIANRTSAGTLLPVNIDALSGGPTLGELAGSAVQYAKNGEPLPFGTWGTGPGPGGGWPTSSSGWWPANQ